MRDILKVNDCFGYDHVVIVHIRRPPQYIPYCWYKWLNYCSYQGDDYDNLVFNDGLDIIKNNIEDKWNEEYDV